MSTELNTLRSMLATAESNLEAHKTRLEEYREDFDADPQPDTLAQIKRTEARIANEEIRITALEFAVNALASAEDATEPLTHTHTLELTLSDLAEAGLEGLNDALDTSLQAEDSPHEAVDISYKVIGCVPGHETSEGSVLIEATYTDAATSE